MKIDLKKINQKYFKKAWTYMTGAVLLSLVQIITLVVTGQPWGITGAFTYWSERVLDTLVGISYTGRVWFLENPISVRNIGIIMGALVSTLLAAQFRFKKIKSGKQLGGAIIGGFLMGYGSRIASGCNIGAFYSSISSLSLSGWVFGLALLGGSIIGGKLLIKYFI